MFEKIKPAICTSVLLVLVLVSACAGSRIGLKEEHLTHLQSAEIMLDITQNEIDIAGINESDSSGSSISVGVGRGYRSGSGVGSFISFIFGTRLGKSRAEILSEYIQPLREQLRSYSYANELKASLENHQTSINWLQNPQVTLNAGIQPQEVGDRLNEINSAVITYQSHYSLTDTLDGVIAKSGIAVFIPNTTPNGNDKPEPVYRNVFTYKEKIIGPDESSKDNEKANIKYLANNIQLVKEALARSHKQIIDMFAYDIKKLDIEETGKDNKTTKYGISGELLRTHNKASWIRAKNGELKAVLSFE